MAPSRKRSLGSLLELPFRPAIAVLNRMAFARKFTLVGLILSVPLAASVHLQASNVTRQIEFNTLERAGVSFLSDAGPLLHAVQRRLVLGAATEAGKEAHAGALAEAEAALSQAMDRMDRTAARLDSALRTAEAWESARGALRDPERAGPLLRALLRRVGNESNLILDPDLDSYWLMHASLVQLPALAEATTRAALAALSRGEGNGRTIALAAESRQEENAAEDLANVDLVTAFRESARFGGRDLRLALETPLADLRSATARHVESLRGAMSGPASGEGFERLVDSSLDALDRTWDLHRRIAPELDALIEARIKRLRAERTTGLAAALAIAAVLTYLFVAIYLSIRNSMERFRAIERAEKPPVQALVPDSQDELGELAHAYGKAQDEKSALVEQLRQADRLSALGMLAAGTAHELNEPLGAILGFAQLARKTPGLPETAERDLSKIEKAVLHAREVIRKLMLFARQTPPEKRALSLAVAVEEALDLIRHRCEQERVTVIKDLAAGLPDLVGDPGQLRQAVLNLVVNALQATAGGGEVRVTLRQREQSLVLTVEDHGTGMTEEVRQQLFLPFFTTKDVGRGTGLGLSIVHGIVTAHGGTIEVESAPGKGSRFSISLPLQDSKDTRT